MTQLRRGVITPCRRSRYVIGTRLKFRRFPSDAGVPKMKLFSCQGCGQLLYFENIRCENCGRALGYIPDLTDVSALEPNDKGGWTALAAQSVAYKFCRNYEAYTCNWMVPAAGTEDFCAACRHNKTIPDLSVPGNAILWGKIEVAKHRLFYSLLRLGLRLENRIDNPEHGLAFEFLADMPETHAQSVMTGHDKGLITLALKEADDAIREKVRAEMGEAYRTLLGHMRHESGHYFWDRLDYDQTLQRHYSQGAPPGWQEGFVSVYATTHPWEDFAETWAHYLHIVDTLETAGAFGLKVKPRRARGELDAKIDFDPYKAVRMDQLIDAWLPIEFATNSLNRSMGLLDLYPFMLTPQVIEKLAFVHALTHERQALRKVS